MRPVVSTSQLDGSLRRYLFEHCRDIGLQHFKYLGLRPIVFQSKRPSAFSLMASPLKVSGLIQRSLAWIAGIVSDAIRSSFFSRAL